MQLDMNDRLSVKQAAEIYGLEGWGNGYLAIGPDGRLRVTPPAARMEST